MTTQNIYSMTDVWDDVGTTFKGISLSVTDTASASGSLLMDLQVGGASRFSVRKDAVLILPSASTLTFSNTSNGTVGTNGISFYYDSVGVDVSTLQVRRTGQTTNLYAFGYSGINLGTARLGFGTSTSTASQDLELRRDAADTLAQRRSTNPQAFRISNTHTDASNYERGKIAWESNVLRIGTEKAGTGSARALELQTDGVTRVTVGATQVIAAKELVSAAGDNNYAFSSSPLTNYEYFAVRVGSGGGGELRLAQYMSVAWTNAYAKATIDTTITRGASSGIILLGNGTTSTDFNRLQFGGTTSSFPALKRSTTSLQARLADDSDFTNVQGKITTETAYTAGAPTATGYIVLYDSTGTAYKVPAEAL